MNLDTKDWKFTISVGFKPAWTDVYENCKTCHGRGRHGGGFHSFDDETECHECFGRGKILVYVEHEPRPEVPESLVKHLVSAYHEWLDKEG